MIFPQSSTGDFSVLYDKNSSSIVTTADTVDVPEKYQFFLVWHLVALAYMGREDDMNKMTFAQKQEDMVMQRALQNRNVNRVIRSRAFGIPTRDYTTINGSFIPLN